MRLALAAVLVVVVTACGSPEPELSESGGSATTTATTSSETTAPDLTSSTTDDDPESATTFATTTTTTPPPIPSDGPGVRGRLTASPTCAVEMAGNPCPPAELPGRRLDAIDSTGDVAGTTTTDDAGRYLILLAPGDYTLQVVIGGPFPSCPETPVTVTGGPPTTIDIECDTGIR